MIGDNDFDENINKEAEVVEYCKSLGLIILDNLINIYGQDFKNKQWLIEPFADIICSISIMHNCFLRYNQLDSGEHKNKTMPVLKLSISHHYRKLINRAKVINSYICDSMQFNGEKERNDFCNISDSSKLNYFPNEIYLKKIIIDEFYKQEKYYLNT